jgi:hypothetical protein
MSAQTPAQPKLDELMARYLQRQAEAHQAGLSSFNVGEVTPYEAGPVQPIDAKLAWDEAVKAIELLSPEKINLKAPPGWATLVAGHEPAVALAFCVGNFPQLVRNFHMILQKANLADLRPQAGRTTVVPGLEDWANETAAKGKYPQVLLALGALRLAKQFELADRFIEDNDAAIPQAWRAAWENEKAALAWHCGDVEKARDMWQRQEASLPVLFNRGMADLFLGHAETGRQAMKEAVAALPENGSWHHLARLYLTLAQGA